MNVNQLIQVRHLKTLQFWLVSLAAGLAAIHLTLSWRADDVDLVGSSVLFFFVIATALKDQRDRLQLDSGWRATGLGIFLVAFLLLRSLLRPSDAFLLLFPAIAGFALSLLASGFRGMRQYQRELILLCFLGIPKVVVPILFDPTPLTARFGTLILHYLGFQVYRDGFMIHLPTGSVEVYSGCSGIDSITHLLSLSGLFLMMVPMGWVMRGLVPLIAGAIAFVVNGFRVALMAHLVASGQPEAFDYWHEGDGSLIFSMIAVFLFGGFCYLTMRWLEAAAEATEEEETEEELNSTEWQEEP